MSKFLCIILQLTSLASNHTFISVSPFIGCDDNRSWIRLDNMNTKNHILDIENKQD